MLGKKALLFAPMAVLALGLAGCAPSAASSHTAVSGASATSGPDPLSSTLVPSMLPAEVAALHPPDGTQACPRPRIGADLLITDAMRKDGSFDPTTINLLLDGEDLTAAASVRTNLTNPVGRISMLYTPQADLALGEHRALLTYATATGPATLDWVFTIVAVPCDH